MQFTAYIFVYPILWIVSILPFRLLYAFSDVLYLLLYYVVRYRKNVVTQNLNLAFPDQSKREITAIKRAFYRHLCDMFLEMAKTMSISEEALKRRFKLINPEGFRYLESLDKSIILMPGHYASWEWSISLKSHISFKSLAVYSRLSNSYFDKLVKGIRSKFNTELISKKEAVTRIIRNEVLGEKSVIWLPSDQSPMLTKDTYWHDFMGVRVPCFTGAERIAKKLNLTVAFLKISKVKRGYYEAEVIPLTENPNEYPDYSLTDLFLEKVEHQIREAPEYYLWTHNRWKHRGKEFHTS